MNFLYYWKKCTFWWVMLDEKHEKKIDSRVCDVRVYIMRVRACMYARMRVVYMGSLAKYYTAISENVKPDSSTWSSEVIPLQVVILTRNPKMAEAERDTLTHIDRNGRLQEIFCRECQAGKHGGAMGRGVSAIGIR